MGDEDAHVRLSAALLVAVGVHGPAIPSISDLPELRLDARRLRVLVALAGGPRRVSEVVTEVAAELEADEADLRVFVDALAARNRLTTVEPTEASEPCAPSRSPDQPDPTAAAERLVDLRAVPQPSSDGSLVLVTPLVVRPTAEGFEIHRRDRPPVVLDVPGFLVTTMFVKPRDMAEAARRLADLPPALRPDAASLAGTVGLLRAEQLLSEFDPDAPGHRNVADAEERLRRVELDRLRTLVATVEKSAEERKAARAKSQPELAASKRTAVFPAQYPVHVPNLALGMIIAYARAYDGGRLAERYDLDPYWLVRPSNVKRLLAEHGPSVFLFSNYVWSVDHTMALSRLVKEHSPESICVHGGPNTPKYPGDTEAFFAANPHIDVAVFNEGEVTTSELLDALDGKLEGRNGDFSMLADVAGLAYRDRHAASGIVRTADRARIEDLDQIPSPFLTGVFADYEKSSSTLVVLETARGCPYGCTFCDWGSATLSRMRKFPLDRVFAELDWLAEHKMPRVFVADSNFGIFERDVEIAEKVAELRRTKGFPLEFHTNYAKNTVKHLEKIIRVLVEAGVTSKGALALQTVDTHTLATVKRSNIKLERYDELASTFRREQLPLYTELMVGLPGATVESFQADLQMVVDREITARIYRTELLVNSPMNEPSYREIHQIRAGGGKLVELAGMVDRSRNSLVTATDSYSEADMDTMMRMRHVFGIVENHSVLRHVARFVHQETGIAEANLYRRIDDISRRDPERYPLIAWLLDTLAEVSAPPLSWRAFYDEVGRFLTCEIGLAPSSALDTVLAVQVALLPDRGRTFPETVELAHDYASWFAQMRHAKEQGQDWCSTVDRLGSFGPAALELTDPDDICGLRIGAALDLYLDVAWEVTSSVSRAAPPHQLTA